MSDFCHILDTVGIVRESRTDLHFLQLRRFLPRDISKFSKQTFLPIFSAPPSPQGSTLFRFTKNKASTKHLLNVCIGISLWKDVWMFLPEDMSNTAAGDDFQAPSTHPHTKRDFYKRSSFIILSFCPRAGWILVLPLTSSSATLNWGKSITRGAFLGTTPLKVHFKASCDLFEVSALETSL